MVQVFHHLCLQRRRCSWSRPVIGAEADGVNSWTWAGEANQPAKGSHEHSGCTKTQLYTRQCAEHHIKICTKEQPKLHKHHAPSLKTHCTGLWAQALKPNFNIATQEKGNCEQIKEHLPALPMDGNWLRDLEKVRCLKKLSMPMMHLEPLIKVSLVTDLHSNFTQRRSSAATGRRSP